MMVKDGSSRKEAASVGRITEAEAREIEVVAEFVAQSAEESAKGGHLLADGCTHPDAYHGRLEIVVSIQLGGPTAFAHAEGARRENAELRGID